VPGNGTIASVVLQQLQALLGLPKAAEAGPAAPAAAAAAAEPAGNAVAEPEPAVEDAVLARGGDRDGTHEARDPMAAPARGGSGPTAAVRRRAPLVPALGSWQRPLAATWNACRSRRHVCSRGHGCLALVARGRV
jgi:hypothetical protein